MTMKTMEQYRKCFEMYPVHSAIAFLRHGANHTCAKAQVAFLMLKNWKPVFIIGTRTPYNETSLEENAGPYWRRKPVIQNSKHSTTPFCKVFIFTQTWNRIQKCLQYICTGLVLKKNNVLYFQVNYNKHIFTSRKINIFPVWKKTVAWENYGINWLRSQCKFSQGHEANTEGKKQN